jgi:nitroreductase
MTKDVFDAIKERRSIRAFKDEEIPEATVTRLLEAACHAPSAGNLQPWKFFVVSQGASKKRLAEAAFGQTFVAEAPTVIVVCALPEVSAARYGDRGRELYCLQDTAAAVQNILLGANALGLGSCWVGAFDEQEAAKVLDLPGHCRPVAMIPLGYPAKEGHLPARRPADEVVYLVGE